MTGSTFFFLISLISELGVDLEIDLCKDFKIAYNSFASSCS